MTEMTSGIGNSAASRDKAYYLHPYTNLKTHEDVGPLVIERGEGVHVYDESGKEYIEGMAGLWCTSLGFGEERWWNRRPGRCASCPTIMASPTRRMIPASSWRKR